MWERLESFETENWSEERYTYNEVGKRKRTTFLTHESAEPPFEYLEELYDSAGRVAERRKFQYDDTLEYREILIYTATGEEPKLSVLEENGEIDDITIYVFPD
jgi:YD repeat-containing protein